MVVVSAATILIQQAAPPEPTAETIARVESGEAVQVLSEAPGSAWPRSTVYAFIEATPEQCAAVLSDYDLQSSYIPRLKTSRTVRKVGKETDVEYVVSVPVYPDERSVSRQHIEQKGEEYKVVWHTVVDSNARGSITSGGAIFRPMTNKRTGKTGTLMIHDQSVVPASMFARVPMVRNKAVEASLLAAIAIQKQVEREVTQDPAKLRAQVNTLRASVIRVDSARTPPLHERLAPLM